MRTGTGPDARHTEWSWTQFLAHPDTARRLRSSGAATRKPSDRRSRHATVRPCAARMRRAIVTHTGRRRPHVPLDRAQTLDAHAVRRWSGAVRGLCVEALERLRPHRRTCPNRHVYHALFRVGRSRAVFRLSSAANSLGPMRPFRAAPVPHTSSHRHTIGGSAQARSSPIHGAHFG